MKTYGHLRTRLPDKLKAQALQAGHTSSPERSQGKVSPDHSGSARNANRPEHRLAIDFMAAMTLKAD